MGLMISRAESFARMAVKRAAIRPIAIVEQDFLRIGVKVGFSAKRHLSNYPLRDYQALLDRLTAFHSASIFDELLVDPPGKLGGIPFAGLPNNFLLEQMDGNALNLTGIYMKYLRFIIRPKEVSLILPPVIPPPIVPAPERMGANLTEPPRSSGQRFSATSFIESYFGFSVETNYAPAANLLPVQKRIVRDTAQLTARCTGGEAPSDAEMRTHTLETSKIRFVRDGERLAAFGAAEFVDGYVNENGGQERITHLAATMVDPDYRRQGLMVMLNYRLLKDAKRAVEEVAAGFYARLFAPAPIIVRTQSRGVFEGCVKFFDGVVPPAVKPDERRQRLVAFMAGTKGWPLNAHNVQKGAYPALRTTADDLIPGLDPTDAYVFAGDLTWMRNLKMMLFVNVLYPLRTWGRGLFR